MSNTISEFGDKLKDAITDSNFYANSYTWKGKKVKNADGTITQETYNLIDCSEEQLRKFYSHCYSMLYNKDAKNPGRYPLLDIIQSQKDRCGVELFLREAEAAGTSRYTINETIRQTLTYSGIKSDQSKNMALNEFLEVTSNYANLPIRLIQEGCIYRLGKFDRSHITMSFILKQGLRLTEEEEKELTELVPDGKGGMIKENYLTVVRNRQNINENMKLKMHSKGLSYSQLRAMLNLRSRPYNELTVEQLKTLRYRLLFSLEDDVNFHIESWEERIEQLKEVAKLKGISL